MTSRPRARGDVIVQSVVEEECAGKGALACLERGYRADVVMIPEPMNDALLKAHVGVIRFQVKARGAPAHVVETGSGVNAIESACRLMTALQGPEDAQNARRAGVRLSAIGRRPRRPRRVR